MSEEKKTGALVRSETAGRIALWGMAVLPSSTWVCVIVANVADGQVSDKTLLALSVVGVIFPLCVALLLGIPDIKWRQFFGYVWRGFAIGFLGWFAGLVISNA